MRSRHVLAKLSVARRRIDREANTPLLTRLTLVNSACYAEAAASEAQNSSTSSRALTGTCRGCSHFAPGRPEECDLWVLAWPGGRHREVSAPSPFATRLSNSHTRRGITAHQSTLALGASFHLYCDKTPII